MDVQTRRADGGVRCQFKQGCTVVDRLGIAVRADPITTPGIVKFYITKRTGGAVTFEALKLSKFATS